MKTIYLTALLVLSIAIPVTASDGMINVQSDSNVSETADLLENILNEKDMRIFNRIKHSKGAGKVGIQACFFQH